MEIVTLSQFLAVTLQDWGLSRRQQAKEYGRFRVDRRNHLVCLHSLCSCLCLLSCRCLCLYLCLCPSIYHVSSSIYIWPPRIPHRCQYVLFVLSLSVSVLLIYSSIYIWPLRIPHRCPQYTLALQSGPATRNTPPRSWWQLTFKKSLTSQKTLSSEL